MSADPLAETLIWLRLLLIAILVFGALVMIFVDIRARWKRICGAVTRRLYRE